MNFEMQMQQDLMMIARCENIFIYPSKLNVINNDNKSIAGINAIVDYFCFSCVYSIILCFKRISIIK